MNLLDSIINETSARDNGPSNTGPRIISRENDLNNIKIGGLPPTMSEGEQQAEIERLIAPGTGWDAGEMGMSLEAATAMVRRANDPESRAKAIEDLKQRAIQRAGLSTDSEGGIAVVVTGDAAWHGVGLHVEGQDESGRLTREELLSLPTLAYESAHADVYVKVGDEYYQVPETRGVYRTDTNQPYPGTVGARHEVLQNSEVVDFVADVLEGFGAVFETAGALGYGERMWVTARMPEHAEIFPGDTASFYCNFYSNNVNGSNQLFPSMLRSVCDNTLRIARAEGKSKGYFFKHTKNIRSRMRETVAAIRESIRRFDEVVENSQRMAQTAIGSPEVFIDNVLDRVVEMTAATFATSQEVVSGADALAAALDVTQAERDIAAKKIQRRIEKRTGLLDTILDLYHNDKNAGKVGETVWAGFNAVTEYADHHVRYNNSGNVEERRAADVIEGRADDIKQVAYNVALASVN